jgi:TonB family protein
MRSAKSSLLAAAVFVLAVVSPAVAQPLVVQAKILEQPEAPYPLAAKATAVEGEVKFRGEIGAAGRVERVEIVSVPEPGLGFEEAVTATVSRWRFSPATLRGNPVTSEKAYGKA